MELTDKERTTLINQCTILQFLDHVEKEHWESAVEVFTNGYEKYHSEYLPHLEQPLGSDSQTNRSGSMVRPDMISAVTRGLLASTGSAAPLDDAVDLPIQRSRAFLSNATVTSRPRPRSNRRPQ